eukprot:scaffold7.g3465.t1
MQAALVSTQAFKPVAVRGAAKSRTRRSAILARYAADEATPAAAAASRRGTLAAGLAAAAALALPPAMPAAAFDDEHKLLCDAKCEADLANCQRVTLNYVAMTPEGRIFDSSLDKGYPYDIRVGAGSVIAGLDEGVSSMKRGGLRRLYIPGDLAFPNGLVSGPGRPRVPPKSPVVFDVELLYIPGISDDE